MLLEDQLIIDALDIYESRMNVIRLHFESESILATEILDPNIDPKVLELFLINYSALGVLMTEPVEGWITRAAIRCQEMGLKELSSALRSHARQEAGHHLMMIQDTLTLVDRWNRRHSHKICADRILTLPMTNGVIKYRKLHENIIASESPFRQIAIEYEIERLSADYGERFIKHCVRILGNEILNGLSFVQEHAAVDIGHTKFNKAQLNRLLTQHPEYAEQLIGAGISALTTYDLFLSDCLAKAKFHLNYPN